MTAFLVRRLLQGALVLAIVAIGLFFLQSLSPIDASAFYINPDFPAEVQQRIRENLGLDKSAAEQFVRWGTKVLQLDFQTSLTKNRPVSELILAALPNTFLLASVSIVLIFTLGMLLGIVQAVRQYTWTDFSLTLTSLFLYSMPSFWLAIMLVLIFSAISGGSWPVLGMNGPAVQAKLAIQQSMIDAGLEPPDNLGFWEKWLDTGKHLVLPAIALGIPSAAGVARYMRSSMLDVISQDFVRTARAKGVAERKVLFRHALRNALIPIITLLGLYMPFLISGAVLVETVFAWPGMGRLIVSSIFERDYPVFMATSLLLTVFVVGGSLLADLLYSAVDPRIRHG